MNSIIPTPKQIRLNVDRTSITVEYQNGNSLEMSAEYLRTHAPSADVQGHGGSGGRLPVGKREVTIKTIEPVGQYAIRIVFSDGHHNGIYTWKTLMSLGVNKEDNWAKYLQALETMNASRDPV